MISNEFGVSHKIKIAYSDYLKRNNIVSDEALYNENLDTLSNIVFVSF